MNDYLSYKLKALSLVAIILVVFIHSYNVEIKFTTGTLTGGTSHSVLFVENFLSKGIARIAVPLFYLISGFLFYVTFDFSLKGVFNKYKKRIKILVIPYLFWSLYGVLLFFLLQSIPQSKNFFTRELIKDYSFSQFLDTLLINPITYQLWFIRDLIMLVVFSPLIGFLTKSSKGMWIFFLVILWYVAPKTFELFSNESLLFFTVGGYLASEKSQPLLNEGISKYWLYFLIAWLVTVLLTTYLLTFDRGGPVLNFLNNTGIVIGILAVWSLYDLVDRNQIRKYSAFFAYSFMIYVFHEPLLTILVKGMFFMWGKTNTSTLLIYLFAPLFTIAICVALRYLWIRIAPRFYDFATGGR
ncbi:MAG TPA: acyltransferase [Cyclobacteriaceae bacterium]|nr:acyltransferase [Cyclobacteriaceae bacterium]